jgi:hypothetical protein
VVDVSDNLSFATATAKATGVDKRKIERAAARGEALGDDLSAVAGTSLDKGVELDALAKMPAGEREEVIARAKAGEKVSARKRGDPTSANAQDVEAAATNRCRRPRETLFEYPL